MLKLLLVDGSALLHRAYHAYPSLTTRTGEVVGAVYGVTSMLITALDEIKPTHVVVAWDLPKPTFRHEKYVAYKAQRPKADQEMVEQIARVKEVITAMGVKQVEQEGFEADDIIGTLAKNYGDEEVVILTGDQDTMQLVTEKVKVMTPAKGKEQTKIFGPEQVKDKYGVDPKQIVDYKALIGDNSDNIPGVAGVGPVTAAKLLSEYNTLDEIFTALKHKSQISNFKLGEQIAEKLIKGKDSAYLSRELSEIVTEMKIEIGTGEIEYRGVANENLRQELEELGFKSLLRRVWRQEPNSEKKKQISSQMDLF